MGVLQCYVLRPLVLLIYINDLSLEISSDINILFADGTSIFSIDYDTHLSANNYFETISQWAGQ